ncbi:hypothetical protein Tco_0289204 [Tanacetum coccineum]
MVANGLTSPRVNGYLVKAHQNHSCSCGGSVTVQVSMLIFLLLIRRLMKVAFGDGFQDVAVQSSGASNERSI